MAELSNLALAAAMALAVAAPSANAEPSPVTPTDVVTALEGAYGVHPGQRRNHTKGMCALGSFVGTPEAASYSQLPGGDPLQRSVEVIGMVEPPTLARSSEPSI